MHTYVRTCINMHGYIHGYLHTYAHTYVHVYTRTYMVYVALIWRHMYSIMRKFGKVYQRVHVYISRKHTLKHYMQTYIHECTHAQRIDTTNILL